jgi:hypothetical protein
MQCCPVPQCLAVFRHALRSRCIVACPPRDVQYSLLSLRGIAVIGPHMRVLAIRVNNILGQQGFPAPAFPDHGRMILPIDGFQRVKLQGFGRGKSGSGS